MKWHFGEYRLDAQTAELTGPDGPIHVERQTFDVLAHLAANADRIVTRDELIEAVWQGRFVSESTVSTSIKLARRAVGDDGAKQAVIKTLHGRGFRFVAPIRDVSPAAITEVPQEPQPARNAPEMAGTGKPSLAVLRFQGLGYDEHSSRIASALPADLVSGLSRVGWLHVIARGSSFRFDPEVTLPEEIAAALAVRYLVTGVVEVVGEMATITVELQSAEDGHLVWAERFATTLSELQDRRSEIIAAIISSLEYEIPHQESLSARLLSETQFDAWTHFHLGLSHLYRFNPGSNLIAAQHFESALAIDAEFARAHAATSFVHWQSAFLQNGESRSELLAEAEASAEKAMSIDAREPFAAFNMARVKWLQGDVELAQDWFDRSLAINPNSAQAHYNRGLMQVIGGNAAEGAEGSKTALRLSPLDPLAYAMYSTRALAAIALDDHAEAVRLAERANQEPGVHFFIPMVAAVANELAGNDASARRWASRARAMRTAASSQLFFRSFPFRENSGREKIRQSFARLGL